MKILSLLILLLSTFGCHSNAQQKQASRPLEIPATDASLKDLHWNLREVLRTQLASTFPVTKGGVEFRKSFSIDYKWSDADSTFVIELPEKQLDVETEAVKGGSKYFIPFKNVAVEDVKFVFSADSTQTGILLPAKAGTSFTFHPYNNDPDEPVQSVLIGWLDRRQDLTLRRGYVLFHQFFKKMKEETAAMAKG
ncbi:MAG: hypothetical protein H6577_04930 [Lewinellaceae bacterium]|nr:hypothetical protein [Saprospiraceae bacterium]MCB9337448.1 hypothetical protein [Lewinellaceae bacterium]